MVKNKEGQFVLENISPLWHRKRVSLQVPTNYNQIELFIDGLEVGDARTRAAERILEHDPIPEFLFFLDYDVLPEYDAIVKLLYRAQTQPDYDIYCGVYCSKSDVMPEPLVYSGNGGGPYWDWAVGDILTTDQNGITSCHMGLTLIRTSLFKKLTNTEEKPYFLSPSSAYMEGQFLRTARGTEDIYFCTRAIQEANAKILVDTSVMAGHIVPSTGKIYGLLPDSPPVLRAKWRDGAPKDDTGKPQKKAIDLGAAADDTPGAQFERRKWPGYVTETVDARKGLGIDYVQDLRQLNFPDECYDLTASRHTLEHIPRWEQERVWSEIFRITKCGGLTEHIVPNVEWAAQKICMGDYDYHTMNVLYGSQEAAGYDRIWNTHFFGYTPQVLQALAEQAGFVDVRVEHYKSRPELGYHMVVHGRKPTKKELQVKRKQTEVEFPTEKRIKELTEKGAKPELKAVLAKEKKKS